MKNNNTIYRHIYPLMYTYIYINLCWLTRLNMRDEKYFIHSFMYVYIRSNRCIVNAQWELGRHSMRTHTLFISPYICSTWTRYSCFFFLFIHCRRHSLYVINNNNGIIIHISILWMRFSCFSSYSASNSN